MTVLRFEVQALTMAALAVHKSRPVTCAVVAHVSSLESPALPLPVYGDLILTAMLHTVAVAYALVWLRAALLPSTREGLRAHVIGIQCQSAIILGLWGGQLRSVVDINEIFQADGLPFSSPDGQLTVNSHVWGWIYKDNANQFWIQINPAFNWTVAFSAEINAWAASFGISLNAPTGTAPRGPFKLPPAVPSGQRYAQCWTKGNSWG